MFQEGYNSPLFLQTSILVQAVFNNEKLLIKNLKFVFFNQVLVIIPIFRLPTNWLVRSPGIAPNWRRFLYPAANQFRPFPFWR